MAIKVRTQMEILETERRVMSFTVTTPPDTDPFLIVTYGEILKNQSDNVLNVKPQIAVLSLNKSQLTGLLIEDNQWKLPNYDKLYRGLRNFFDDQLKVNFSGLFPN